MFTGYDIVLYGYDIVLLIVVALARKDEQLNANGLLVY